MPSRYPVPKPDALGSLVTGLIATATEVSFTDAQDPERDASGVFAEWINDSDELAVLGFGDHDIVNFAGGAMMGIEAAALVELGATGVLHEESIEGFREVGNVLTSCFNTDFTRHLRLRNLQKLPGQIEDDVKQLWRAPRARRAYRFSVENFGAGNLILYFS
ncbi:MAG: hypothetical protein SGJ13_01630 [Actinomycetota bacterium]|nr:hypothetical protein [Actinomycetota bacterium]